MFQMTPKLKYVFAKTLILNFCLIVIFCSSLKVKDFEVKGWGKNVSRNWSVYIRDDIKIFPPNLCQRKSALLMAVSSKPSNIKARIAIRNTWGSQKRVLGERVEIIFLLGNSLNSSTQKAAFSESTKYNDIVMLDFIDSYNNLTLKSISMLKLAVSKCSGKTNFLLKADDDIFVNLPRLMKLLLGRNYSENILLGKKNCFVSPIKRPLSKWYCPKYIYGNQRFPPFLSGSCYLVSMAAANKLYTAALNLPLIHLEDVFITGISAERAGIVPEFNNEFMLNADGVKNDYCKLKNMISIHDLSPEEIREQFHHLNRPDDLDCPIHEQRMFEAKKWTTGFENFSICS